MYIVRHRGPLLAIELYISYWIFSGNAESATINRPDSLMMGRSELLGELDEMMRWVRILMPVVVVVQLLTTSYITAGDQQDMALAVDVVPHTLDVLLFLSIRSVVVDAVNKAGDVSTFVGADDKLLGRIRW